MNRYITDIKINKLYHLQDFTISIEEEQKPHLFITGKNGSGKTVLLRAVSEFIDSIKDDMDLDFLHYQEQADYWKDCLIKAESEEQKLKCKNQMEFWQKRFNTLYGKVNVVFQNIAGIIEKYKKNEFIFAFYQSNRNVKMDVVDNLRKPQIKEKMGMEETTTSQFLYYLTDLKIQEALARNENKAEDADKIKDWFIDFENLLRRIFCDQGLKLDFNYKNYEFTIETASDKCFDFNHMSDGYAAILDIVVDLIMRMQSKDSLTRAYDKEGIVLIDEVETHLHLQLQKDVMPILTQVFPHIQFIVTTHSPFVLNSINNGVAYDLEHREPISDLTQYSYGALVEGYFGVDTDSSYVEEQLAEFERLLKSSCLTNAEKIRLKYLKDDFDRIPEPVSPEIVGRYRILLIRYNDKIKDTL